MEGEVKLPISTHKGHRFPSGKDWNGNRNGRPVAPEIEELRQALRAVRKHKGNRPLLVHAVERAYINDNVLVALLKKLVPDRVSKELSGEIKGGDTKIIIVRPQKNEVISSLMEQE